MVIGLNVQNIIKKYADSGNIPGVSVGLIKNSNTEFFNYGVIERDSKLTPNENTVYEIASVSKTFTSILLAILQKEKLLDKDDSVTKYVPELANIPDFKKITLYHLATHTSGLPNLPTKLIIFNLFALLRPSSAYQELSQFTKSDLIRFFSKSKLKTEPGTEWHYSNGTVGLLGHIFELVTNSSYDDLVKSKICDALGMTNTGINLLESHKNLMASGHSYFGKKINHWVAPAIEGAAGLYSTTSDLIKFLETNLGFIDTSISSELKYCHATRFVPKLSYFMKNMMMPYLGIELDEMALGWWVSKQNNQEILFHDGGTAGFSSFIGIEPAKKKGVVLLANKMSRQVHKLGMELLKYD
jgi:CubicO group peptidase (beta-lactamase class C family)